MSQLSINELKAKIKFVEQDLEQLRLTGNSSRKLEVMTEYLNYLKDDLKILQDENKSRTSS